MADWENRQREQRRRKLLSNCGASKRHVECRPASDGPWAEKADILKRRLGEGYLIALLGIRGTGKTQLGVELVLHACRNDKCAKYVKAIDLLLSIRACYGNNERSEDKAIADWVYPRLLVIDELQERGHTEWEDVMLTNIIDKRYAQRDDTILIANLTEAEFVTAAGASISSRLTECGGIIVCDWPSFRPQINEDIPAELET